jgi:hypothetical protein
MSRKRTRVDIINSDSDSDSYEVRHSVTGKATVRTTVDQFKAVPKPRLPSPMEVVPADDLTPPLDLEVDQINYFSQPELFDPSEYNLSEIYDEDSSRPFAGVTFKEKQPAKRHDKSVRRLSISKQFSLYSLGSSIEILARALPTGVPGVVYFP